MKFLYIYTPEFEKQDIEVLNLGERARHVLRRNAINTLGDIGNITKEKLASLHGCGVAVEKEISNKFFNYYLESLSEEKRVRVLKSIEELNSGKSQVVI